MASFEVPQPESAGFGVSDLMHHIELPESGQLLAVLDATCTNVRVSIGNLPDWMNLLCVIHDRFRDCMAVKVTTEIDVVPLLLARLSYAPCRICLHETSARVCSAGITLLLLTRAPGDMAETQRKPRRLQTLENLVCMVRAAEVSPGKPVQGAWPRWMSTKWQTVRWTSTVPL